MLRERAWDFLQRLAVDVALVQEALPTGRGSAVVFRDTGIKDDRVQPPRDLKWGSGVVSYGPSLRAVEYATGPFSKTPVALMRTFPGSVAVAEIAREMPIAVISVYGVIDHGYAESTIHRILSDLTPFIDERRGRRIILAGDLNITTQWSARHRSFLRGRHEECLRREVNLFARFEALGLRNIVVRTEPGPLTGCECQFGEECRHVRTQRHDRSTFPWQNDYMFMSQDLLDEPFSVEVLDQDEAWQLSGHCPIVLELPNL